VTLHGLCFTPLDFVKTKLLKLLDDAHHATHFLYQDVLNLAKEANQFKIVVFSLTYYPQGTDQRSNTLKNWHSYCIVAQRPFG
jgi:hypothetical protein